MATIRIDGIQQAEDLNRDGTVTIGERVQASLILWGIMFVALNVVYAALAAIIEWDEPARAWAGFWLPMFVIVDTVGVTSLAVWRLIIYERGEKLEGEERRRRWEREDWEMDQIRGTVAHEGNTRVTPATRDFYAKLFLQRYYQGKSIARDGKGGWVDSGLPKEMWDLINGMMKDRKIRKGRSKDLEPATFAEAWGIWCDHEVKARRWVRNGPGPDDFLSI